MGWILGMWFSKGTGQESANDGGGYLNIPTPTLGGKQFWTDFVWDDDWRVQQNALTGHWRLISPKNVRYAWGSQAACEAAMRERVPADRQADARLVVLVHGLMRSSSSMAPTGDALSEAGVGRVVYFDYASTRRGIAEHAHALRYWIEHLPGEPRIDFVCHSMGNIVVRHLMADLQREGDPAGILPRLGKMVMLGPPNQGADIARQLGKLGLFEIVTGRGGMELGPAWEAFQKELVTPPCPFMIIAGDINSRWLKNPLVNGPSDLVVRVDEARLEGCEALYQVPVPHSFLMNDAEVQRLTGEYLRIE
jgi:pimeloyl-ACP methyl ester carboxylesterase